MNISRTPIRLSFPPSEATAEEGGLQLSALARTLRWGRWWILLATLVGLGLGGCYAFLQAVPLYTAQAKVVLERREGGAFDFRSTFAGLTGKEPSMTTEVEIIGSRRLAGKLVRRLELAADPEFNAAIRPVHAFSVGGLIRFVLGPAPAPAPETQFHRTVDAVLEAVSVSNVPDSYVFVISAETTSPEKSATIANTLADLYILDQLEVKHEATKRATAWLGEEVVSLKAELEAAEGRLSEYRASARLASPEALAALNLRMKDLRERRDATSERAMAAEARAAAIQAALERGTGEELAELVDRTVAEASGRPALERRATEALRRARQDAARERGQVAVLERSIAELEESIARQSSELVTLQQLEREVEATALIYESFLSRMKEISVQLGLEEADARLLSEAVPREIPTAPRRGFVLALSGLLGLLGGGGLVLLREQMQNTFRTGEELERQTGLPVLAQVPRAPARSRADLLGHMIANPTSAFSEGVRDLRTSVLLSDVDEPPGLIMFTSSTAGEGKTAQSLSLARNLSLMGRRVLLIEGDIRRRSFGEYLDLPKEAAGLVSVVSGARPFSEVVVRSAELGADVLAGERVGSNPADFFSSRRFAELLRCAREAYDAVIIDAPPVLAAPEVRVMAGLADALVYVVRWDKTPKTQVLAGLRALQSVEQGVTGLVLSQVDAKGMKRYGYGDLGGAHQYGGA